MTGQHMAGMPAAGSDPHMIGALLQATMAAARITALVGLAWDGPQVWSFAVTLGLGEQPERVQRLAGALGLAAGADSCRVARQGGKLYLEIAKPPEARKPLRAARLDGLPAPTPWAVALGIGTGGQVVWFDLADERNAHLVVGGVSGSGKSCAVSWLLYRLAKQNAPADLNLLLIDPKGGELAPFARLPHLLHAPISAPLEIARALAWAGAELDRRLASGTARPRLVIVIEEAPDVCATVPDAAPLLARLAQVGRSAGITVIAVAQQPGARSLGPSLVNFPARLVGRVASQTLTFGAAGRARTGAGDLLGRGDMLLICGADVTRLQVPLVDGRQLGTLPTGGPGSLAAELPSLALFADRARDPRGGHTGRRELGPADYSAIEAALEAGAGPDDLRGRFGIGWARALRLYSAHKGDQ